MDSGNCLCDATGTSLDPSTKCLTLPHMALKLQRVLRCPQAARQLRHLGGSFRWLQQRLERGHTEGRDQPKEREEEDEENTFSA